MAERSSSLHVVYEPQSNRGDKNRTFTGIQYYGDAAVDVIAVQGLGSSYEWTWSTAIPGQERSRYYWLKQSIPQDLPDARVLAYDYDTSWFGDPTRTSLEECGARLLRTILADRSHAQHTSMCPCRARRPIIFIGHSFGGLVIKQSLILAGRTDPSDVDYEDHQAFLNAVTSIIYLGTPHKGSVFPALAKWKIRAGSVLGIHSDETLLRILSVDSALLSYVQKEYEFLERKPVLAGLQTYCYYEMKDVKLGPLHVGIVVTKESACVGSTSVRGLNRHHMSLNKFGANDKEYNEQMRPDLLKCFETADGIAQARFSSREYGSATASVELQNLARYIVPLTSNMSDRLAFNCSQQETPVYKTCTWIHDIEIFKKWETSNDPASLWIHGKSGSGKSILASYITKALQPTKSITSWYEQSCETSILDAKCDIEEPKTTVLYFLCGVQPGLESPMNFLGTLIDQLLSRHPHKWRLHKIAAKTINQSRENGDASELAILLAELITIIGDVSIIVDGLEENPRYAECLEVLNHASKSSSFRLLLTSQNLSMVERTIRNTCSDLHDLEITKYTRNDINAYITSETTHLVSIQPQLKEKQDFIVQELSNNADGVFQWVKASLTHLDADEVRAEDVEQMLNDAHGDMTATYDKIMAGLYRKAHGYQRKRIEAALYWLCSAAVPLRASLLFSAILLGDDYLNITIEQIEHAEKSESDAAQYLKTLLGSTIELIHVNDGTFLVQLFHTSFRQHLTTVGGPNVGATESSLRFSLCEAQRYCAAISMTVCTMSCERLTQKGRSRKQRLLTDYAWNFWAYHLKASEAKLYAAGSIGRLFDRMIKFVSADILAVLAGLAQFTAGRFSMDKLDNKHYLNFVRAFQTAQESLEWSMKNITALINHPPTSTELQLLRKQVETATKKTIRSATDPPLDSSKSSSRRRKTAGSRIKELHIDTLDVDDTARVTSLTLALLGSVTQGLRLTASAIAAETVFKELSSQSNSELSIVTMLVEAGNFFDNVGSYPYWDIITDLPRSISAFETSGKDEYADQASMVLYRVGVSERAGTELSVRRDASILTILKTMNDFKDPKVDLTATQFYTSRLSYGLEHHVTWQRDWKVLLLNSSVSWLYMRPSEYVNLDFMSSQPHSLLQEYIPEVVAQNPFSTYIAAVPSILSVYFAHWIRVILNAAFDWGHLLFVANLARVRSAAGDMKACWESLQLFNDPSSLLTRTHWVVGFAVYVIRWKYFFWFGGHTSPHPIRDTYNVFYDPKQFMEDNVHGWWILIKYTLFLFFCSFINGLAASVVKGPYNLSKAQLLVPSIYLTFWIFTSLERAICEMVNAIAWPTMLMSLLFQDPETVAELVQFSMRYWFRVFFTIANTGISNAVLEFLGLWWYAGSMAIFFLALWYVNLYDQWAAKAVWDATEPLRQATLSILYGSFSILPKLFPFILPLGAVACIFYALDLGYKFSQDPLDMTTTGRKLQVAMSKARPLLRDRAPFRIKATQQTPAAPPARVTEEDMRNISKQNAEEAGQQEATTPGASGESSALRKGQATLSRVNKRQSPPARLTEEEMRTISKKAADNVTASVETGQQQNTTTGAFTGYPSLRNRHAVSSSANERSKRETDERARREVDELVAKIRDDALHKTLLQLGNSLTAPHPDDSVMD